MSDEVVRVTVCGFCKGGPVADAASWLDGKPRPPAPCPRCGKVYGEREADRDRYARSLTNLSNENFHAAMAAYDEDDA